MDVSDKASYYIEKKEIKEAKWGEPKFLKLEPNSLFWSQN
jgi:hypothetical protein